MAQVEQALVQVEQASAPGELGKGDWAAGPAGEPGAAEALVLVLVAQVLVVQVWAQVLVVQVWAPDWVKAEV